MLWALVGLSFAFYGFATAFISVFKRHQVTASVKFSICVPQFGIPLYHPYCVGFFLNKTNQTPKQWMYSVSKVCLERSIMYKKVSLWSANLPFPSVLCYDCIRITHEHEDALCAWRLLENCSKRSVCCWPNSSEFPSSDLMAIGS